MEFLIILILVLANGAFSMSELAVVSSRKVRLQQRAENGDKGAEAALALTESPTRFLSTVQIGITLIGTLTGAYGGAQLSGGLRTLLEQVPYLRPIAGTLSVLLIVLLITYLSLVLGELVPKRLAMTNPEGVAAAISRPMAGLSRVASPLVHFLSWSTEMVVRLMGIKKSADPPVTPEEITVLMEQGEEVGIFEEAETDIVESVFRLSDLYVEALMTPRKEIDWVDADEPLEETLRYVMDSPHNHFPVAKGDLDNVVGILRGKDLLARTTENVPFDLLDLTQPAQFIPESMPAFQALEVLKFASGNLVLVIDEYGGIQGMVTLFDVMEAMVGGISEQGEPVEPLAVQREDGSWLIEGMMRIDALKDLLDVDSLPEEDRIGYQTVGGFVMAQLGSVPTVGQSFEANGWKIEVVDMDGMRVDKILANKTQ